MIQARKTIYISMASIMAVMIFQWKTAFTNAAGPPGGYTNAPGESVCTSCHGGKSLKSGLSVITLKSNDTTFLTYAPDSVYTIKVIAAQTGTDKWGFQACALKDSTKASIGSFSLISTSSDVQIVTSSLSGSSRSYVEHTSSSNTGNDGRSWIFKWKAPHTNVGNITFYVVVNAADGDGFDTGDQIYASTFSFQFKLPNTPDAGFTYTPVVPCTGDSIAFKDTSTLKPTSWAWSFQSGTPSTSNLQNPKVHFGNGTYNVSLVATNKFGASLKITKTVTITSKPSDTVYVIGSNPICQGDSLALIADYGGTAYKWSSGQTDQIIHVHSAGSYHCTVSNGGCSTISKSINVSVIPIPDISLTRTVGSNSLCEGDTVKFSLSTNGNTFHYFNNGSILTGDSANSLVLSNLSGSNLIYAIAYGSTGCPSDTSTKYLVNVVAKPTITLLRTTGKDSICVGDTLKFKATSSVKTFSIYANGKAIATNVSSISIPGLADTNNKIYAIAYNSLGCPSDTSQIYNENVSPRLLAPALSAGKPTTQSVSISWAPVIAALGYEVSVDSGKTWKAPTGNLSDSEINLGSNVYVKLEVRATNVSPCGHAPTGTILVSTLPCSQTTYNLNVDSEICLHSSASIVFSNISAQHYSIILNKVASKDTAFSFTPLKDTTYHFSMFDSLKSACGAFNIDIPVKVVSVPHINISRDKPFYCGNEIAVITADTGYTEYDIFKNGVHVSDYNSNNYNDSSFNNGDFIIEIGKIDGCQSDSSNAIILHKFEPPVAGFSYSIVSGMNILFNDTTKAEQSRTWYFGDHTTDTSINPEHTYPAINTYNASLVAIGKGGCKDSVNKTIALSGIDVAIDPQSLSIVPNPFNNFLKISFYVTKSLYLHLYIVSETGSIAVNLDRIHTVIGYNEIKIPVDGLKPGSYILNMEGAGQVISRRIIKI